MKEPFSEDVLSAYLDGELSPEERARVEHRLERDGRARERLEDFRRLSQLLAGLPRAELPMSFSAEVLQAAERRMLIPDAAGHATRWRARRWMAGVAGSLAAAAAVLMIIQAIPPGEKHAGRGRELASGNMPAPAAPHNGPRDMVGQDRAEPEMIIAESSKRSGSLSDATFSSEPAAAPFGSSVSRAGGAGMGGGGALPPLGDALDAARQIDPRLAEIGRKIQEINDSDEEEQVVPVTVYVADRAEGLVLVQRIFEASNVHPEEDAESAERKTAPEPRSADEALFVVADSDQVIAAFSKMLERDHPSLRVELEAPIEVASLDREAQERFEQVVRELSGAHAAAREIEQADFRHRKVPDGAGDAGKPVVDRRPGATDKTQTRADFQKKAASKEETPKKGADEGLESALPHKQSREPQDAPPAADTRTADKAEEAQGQSRAGRQFMAPAPRELDQLRNPTKKKRPAPARAMAKSPATDVGDGPQKDQAASGDDAAKRLPLVRVLIRVESESRPPAGSSAAKKADRAP